jgi:hypothetical protein
MFLRINSCGPTNFVSADSGLVQTATAAKIPLYPQNGDLIAKFGHVTFHEGILTRDRPMFYDVRTKLTALCHEARADQGEPLRVWTRSTSKRLKRLLAVGLSPERTGSL